MCATSKTWINYCHFRQKNIIVNRHCSKKKKKKKSQWITWIRVQTYRTTQLLEHTVFIIVLGCCGNFTLWCECCVCVFLLVWALGVVPAGEDDVLFTCGWLCGCKKVRGYTEGQRPSDVIPPRAVSADFMCRPSSQISIGRGRWPFPRSRGGGGRSLRLLLPGPR